MCGGERVRHQKLEKITYEWMNKENMEKVGPFLFVELNTLVGQKSFGVSIFFSLNRLGFRIERVNFLSSRFNGLGIRSNGSIVLCLHTKCGNLQQFEINSGH